ncbi:hypothetical protein HPC38_02830 [Pasteurellaceae bacterium HPA106]|uniref:hypothetical protein n=1 Tax=Spirabiliibacterium pneumoniae TaxID=221400 RepID=UPI001AACB557|nr:hypothetical protein [Spirabiliibacterium pneumoniae]MBE2895814.1 hypothetical protein [Spirabiliibacterium pneumoniae]
MRYLLLLTALLLTACTTTVPPKAPIGQNPNSQRFVPPSAVHVMGKTFVRGKTVDLIEMQKYRYTTTANGVLKEKVSLFFDQNRRTMSLQQRLALRQHSYQRSHTWADLHIADHHLYSTVIYRPSAQYRNYGVELTKGKNIAKCGYLELQYSYAVAPTSASQLEREIIPQARMAMDQLQRQPLTWACR